MDEQYLWRYDQNGIMGIIRNNLIMTDWIGTLSVVAWVPRKEFEAGRISICIATKCFEFAICGLL